MSTDVKNVVDALMTFGGIVGGLITFWKGIHEWREGLRHKRAEQLDKVIERFEATPLLRFGTTVLDWTTRRVRYDGADVVVKNRDVLAALRDHRLEDGDDFPGTQALIRDALDALLSFFDRLNVAIDAGLVEREPAVTYFGYWVRRLVLFDAHPVDRHDPEGAELVARHPQLRDMGPADLVARYIAVYGNGSAVRALARKCKLTAGELEPLRKAIQREEERRTARAVGDLGGASDRAAVTN